MNVCMTALLALSWLDAAQPPIDWSHVRSQVALAAKDPSRPRFHFVPPAKELIDVWGGMRFGEGFRLFYDLNLTPLRRMGGTFMQLETKDFVHWTQLPPAQYPDFAAGELRLNDGCVMIRDDGTPLMYLTRVFADGRDREHIALLGDRDMMTFRRIGREGTITLENHGGPAYYGGWSDVYSFSDGGKRFMIISKCVRRDTGKPETPIYEAEDPTCLKWRYRGTFFDDNGEVLNFGKVDGHWVLIYCPYDNPVCHVGTFDPTTGRFTSRKRSVLSHGFSCGGSEYNLMSRGFYATSLMERANGRQVITAWIGGFLNPEGWDGCIAAPRDLSVDSDLNVRMMPVRELESLRYNERSLAVGKFPTSGAFDLEVDFFSWVEVRVGKSLVVTITPKVVSLNETTFPVKDPHSLRLLVDVSTAELFVDGGLWNATRAIPMLREGDEVRICGESVSGRMYDMKPVPVSDPYHVFR